MNLDLSSLEVVDALRLYLSFGVKNARTQRQLAQASGYSVREIQAALEAMKRSGEPVVSGAAGIWLSQSAEELRDAYRRDRNRAIRQLVNNRGRLKAIAALEKYEQTTLFDEAA